MAIFIFSHWMSYEFPNLLVKLEKNTANHFGKILLVYEIYPLIIWSEKYIFKSRKIFKMGIILQFGNNF